MRAALEQGGQLVPELVAEELRGSAPEDLLRRGVQVREVKAVVEGHHPVGDLSQNLREQAVLWVLGRRQVPPRLVALLVLRLCPFRRPARFPRSFVSAELARW